MEAQAGGTENGAARMQERLQRRHQARAEDVERRKEAKESHSVSEENCEYFSSAFQREKEAIEELLAGCSGSDRSEVSGRLEEATAQILQLQRFVNDSVPFLTQYDLRRAQAALQKLQTSMTETREECLPKKKFAFRSRAKAADKDKTPVADAAGAVDVVDTSSKAGGSGSMVSSQVDGVSEQCGFSNMSNEFLTKSGEEILKQDVLVTHLTNCKVRLYGSPSTLHLKHLDGCEILCGPVSSSVFVDHCTNCTLAFPCQQLRTHNTTDTRVYLHVTSRAIIEDCKGISFAPFSWSYPSLEEDFAVSGLDQERNNWSQVDDFNWLAAGTPSPNWTVLPEGDRRNNWDT